MKELASLFFVVILSGGCGAPANPSPMDCGKSGEPCCSGLCSDGLECAANVCKSAPSPSPSSKCGSSGEACCSGSACNSGLACVADSCKPVSTGAAEGDPCDGSSVTCPGGRLLCVFGQGDVVGACRQPCNSSFAECLVVFDKCCPLGNAGQHVCLPQDQQSSDCM